LLFIFSYSIRFLLLNLKNFEPFQTKGQYTKETNELKMKIQKIEHENIIIKQDVSGIKII